MHLRHLLLTTLFLLLLTALPARADGPVWKVTKGGSTLFLGGTIHMLGQDDYPLPETFETAYSLASQLVLETDLDQLQSPEFQQKMLREMLLTDGQTLQDVLQPETWRAVATFAAARQISLESLQRFKPSMLTIVLTARELQRLGLAGTGVDMHYQQRAKADHKPLGELESADAQLAFLAGMGAGREDAMVDYSLEELKELPEILGALKTAWRHGDTAAMARVALDPWKQDFPEVYQELLVERNRAWLPQIEALLDTPQVELVLVGALHLAGRDGLLQRLAARGCRIEQL